MARRAGWSVFFGLILGTLGASLFWLYGPYPTGTRGKEELSLKEVSARQNPGFRFQTVTDGKQIFLADLKEGRVWRYFQTTRNNREEEGFLSLPMFYEGKSYYGAAEVKDSGPAKGEEKKGP